MRQTRSQTRTKSIADTSANRSIEYNELKVSLCFNRENIELMTFFLECTIHKQVDYIDRIRSVFEGYY